MNLTSYFRSVLEQDTSPIVLCDLQHTIIYMNPSAIERYAKNGGEKLIGKSLLYCHPKDAQQKIQDVLKWFESDKTHNRVLEFQNTEENKDVYMIALRDEQDDLIGYYEKHEYRTNDVGPTYVMG